MDWNYVWALGFAVAWTALGYAMIRSNTSDADKHPMIGPGVPPLPAPTQRGNIVYGLAYQWTELQPSLLTWHERAQLNLNLRSLRLIVGTQVLLVVGMIAITAWNWGLSSDRLAAISLWVPLLALIVAGLAAEIDSTEGRADDAQIPVTVNRQAFVERGANGYAFVVMSQLPEQPWLLDVCVDWNDVTQFGKTDYWATFGGGGKVDVAGGWHAISMAPAIGHPLLISSTMEADGPIYARLSMLNAIFSATAREMFEQGMKASNSKSLSSTKDIGVAEDTPRPGNADKIPDAL